ncbi:hypothetical protein F4604DRAFT_1927380 [Suillus subluteus]|nr:hypothetical protein F4604DRAFT_1927380 [Suillus subluteus]
MTCWTISATLSGLNGFVCLVYIDGSWSTGGSSGSSPSICSSGIQGLVYGDNTDIALPYCFPLSRAASLVSCLDAVVDALSVSIAPLEHKELSRLAFEGGVSKPPTAFPHRLLSKVKLSSLFVSISYSVYCLKCLQHQLSKEESPSSTTIKHLKFSSCLYAFNLYHSFPFCQ